jgi:hypothetical protein
MVKATKVNDWRVDVRFQSSGALLATASGVLLVPPRDAVAFVTDEGAGLFGSNTKPKPSQHQVQHQTSRLNHPTSSLPAAWQCCCCCPQIAFIVRNCAAWQIPATKTRYYYQNRLQLPLAAGDKLSGLPKRKQRAAPLLTTPPAPMQKPSRYCCLHIQTDA